MLLWILLIEYGKYPLIAHIVFAWQVLNSIFSEFVWGAGYIFLDAVTDSEYVIFHAMTRICA